MKNQILGTLKQEIFDTFSEKQSPIITNTIKNQVNIHHSKVVDFNSA